MKTINKAPSLSQGEGQKRKGTGRCFCLILLLLAVPLSQVSAQQAGIQTAAPADANTIDLGDTYTADGHVFKLKRLGDQIVVKHRENSSRFSRDSVAISGVGTIYKTASIQTNISVWKDNSGTSNSESQLKNLIQRAAADPDVEYAFPVYVVEGHDLRLYGGDEAIVKFRSDVTIEQMEDVLAKESLAVKSAFARLENTFIVRLRDPHSNDVLTAIARLGLVPEVEWAEHNFPQEIKMQAMPSDPYFAGQQWHLDGYANFGADPNANVHAVSGWSGAQPYGSPGIVVAVLDNGVQTSHPTCQQIFSRAMILGRETTIPTRQFQMTNMEQRSRAWSLPP